MGPRLQSNLGSPALVYLVYLLSGACAAAAAHALQRCRGRSRAQLRGIMGAAGAQAGLAASLAFNKSSASLCGSLQASASPYW